MSKTIKITSGKYKYREIIIDKATKYWYVSATQFSTKSIVSFYKFTSLGDATEFIDRMLGVEVMA